MNAKLLWGFGLAAILLAGPAQAQRAPVPIVNHPDVPVATGSGKAPQAEQVKAAIETAAKVKGWTLSYEPGGGRILATLVVRNKHTVMVEIAYSAEKYSLMYRDSINMKYSPGSDRAPYDLSSGMRGYRQPPGPVIHPFYNDWVRELKDAIRLELLKI